jgi:oxazoline/thiazoline dehydrogenase
MEGNARTSPPPGQSRGPAVRELYRLRADARLYEGENGAIALRQARFEATIAHPGAGGRAMLLRLAEQWTDDTEIGRVITSTEGEHGIMPGQLLLRRLVMRSWLRRRLQVGDRPLLDVVPLALGDGAFPHVVRHEPGAVLKLSRFVSVSADGTSAADGSGLVAQTPLATVAVAFPDTQLAGLLVPAATSGFTPADLAKLADLDERAVGAVLDELLTAAILVSPTVHRAEIAELPQAVWAACELQLHHRARTGTHALPIGGTLRFRGQFPAAPLRGLPDPRSAGSPAPDRSEPGGSAAGASQLPVPDLEAISQNEPSLTEVIIGRRSIRDHDATHPISDSQLAEFLYRVQHTSRLRRLDDGQEVAERPYPAGGQLCELEIYPLVFSCAGLVPGLYRYDSVDHRLIRLAPMRPAAHRMLAYARDAAAMPDKPQVLLVITARVQRLLWKYEGMGYALALKNSGVLTGLMYLVATAMGLAPCALGTGDSAAFAELSGLDPLVEPSIADFALGSRAPEHAR